MYLAGRTMRQCCMVEQLRCSTRLSSAEPGGASPSGLATQEPARPAEELLAGLAARPAAC